MGTATKIENIPEIDAIPKCYFEFGNYSDIREMSLGVEKNIGSLISFIYVQLLIYKIKMIDNAFYNCRLPWSFGIN